MARAGRLSTSGHALEPFEHVLRQIELLGSAAMLALQKNGRPS